MLSVVTFVLALVVLVSAVWVVTLRNLFRAALALGLALIGVAGLFILLEAEFLAFVQILVYVGAVLTLVVFAIMLTAKLHGDSTISNTQRPWPAVVISLGLFILLCMMTQSVQWPTVPLSEPVEAAAIGQQFMTTLVLPFEIISLVFVVALVGAVTLAVGTRRGSQSS